MPLTSILRVVYITDNDSILRGADNWLLLLRRIKPMAKFEAKINYNNYNGQVIRTIEAHTEGEYCRVALDCPDVPGNTMIEKKN